MLHNFIVTISIKVTGEEHHCRGTLLQTCLLSAYMLLSVYILSRVNNMEESV